MPKDRRVNFLSSHRTTVSPYACSSKDSNGDKLECLLLPVGDEKEWEEARCPICMEHPHNTVLLLCSSREKGCLPYMCDTSHRHSNCLDQFSKSTSTASPTDVRELVCPLCRGQISGWLVIETARRYMNCKVRSCSWESCNFSGNYSELRKHARQEHPTVRPSEVDPERESQWLRLQQESNFQDTLSLYQSQFGYDLDDDHLLGYDMDEDYSPTEQQLDLDFHDAFNRIPFEAEDILDDDGDVFMDLDSAVEFAFTFLSDFPSAPSEGWRSIGSATAGGRNTIRRPVTSRSRPRLNYQRETTSPTRQNTTRSSMSSSLRLNYQRETTSHRRQEYN